MKFIGKPFPWIRNVFIDGGGHNGSSVRKFRKEYDPFRLFNIYTFEPNHIYTDCYKDFHRHTLIQSALFNKNSYKLFYLDPEDGDGSTFFINKKTKYNGGYGILDTSSPVTVKTIDLSKWIKENFVMKDFIILKLDVEGAEYDILEKMIYDNTIKMIHYLFVEWHWQKINILKSRHDNLINTLHKYQIPVLEWDAQNYR